MLPDYSVTHLLGLYRMLSNRRCSRQAKLWMAAAAGGLILVVVPPSAAALFDRLQLNAIR